MGKMQEKQGFGLREGAWVSVGSWACSNGKVPIIHPTGDVKQAARYVRLKLMEAVQGRHINLGVISI